MNDRIWQTAAGGLLRAVQALNGRCPASDAAALPPIDPLAEQCLARAEALVAGGKALGSGRQALAPAFGHLKGHALSVCIADPGREDPAAACPGEAAFGALLPLETLQKETSRLNKQLAQDLAAKDYDRLETDCENVLSLMPAFPGDERDGDISLYDFGRLAAALASCFAQKAQSGTAPAGNDENSLLLFTCDFSGIQSFIYQISTKSALRMLRSRSFYLELVMEHLIDELLAACGLTRANCIYAGGGHAYVLLPNTEQAKDAVNTFDQNVNAWLREQFGISLYLACAAQPCSPGALFGSAGQEAYSDVFRALSKELGRRKLRRCDAAALRRLNSASAGGRECEICGRVAQNGALCSWCESFAALGGLLTKPHLLFAVAGSKLQGSKLTLPLPAAFGPRYACLLSQSDAHLLAGGENVLRWYCKNGLEEGFETCRRLWVGDHCPEPMLEALCEKAKGISRLGVFRADVDDLGASFISGFREYTSLLRTAAFSRCVSLFFKRYINQILDKSSSGRGVLVVYSGGDDLFLVGAWSELLFAAQELQAAFARYTGGALTFSGGFGLYNDHYPLARAAQEVAELEELAKKAPGKNALVLFAAEESLRFDWPTFQTGVMAEKYALIQGFFRGDETGRGNAFLYQLLEHLRGAANDKLNLARCAYLLARLRPAAGATPKQEQAYSAFSEKFYQWALEPAAREQLIAAIYLYVYLHRAEKEEALYGEPQQPQA